MLLSQILATSWLEWCAVVFAIAYVILAAKQHIACWPCAFLSTAIYTHLFWQVALPFQSILNAYYMLMAVYGFWQWSKGKRDEGEFVVKALPRYAHLLLLPGAALIGWGLASIFQSQFSSDYLLLDAFIQVASMMTTYLVTKKYLDNWLYWILINALSAWLFWQTGLALTGILFATYVGFAVYGYVQWQRTAIETSTSSVPT